MILNGDIIILMGVGGTSEMNKYFLDESLAQDQHFVGYMKENER